MTPVADSFGFLTRRLRTADPAFANQENPPAIDLPGNLIGKVTICVQTIRRPRRLSPGDRACFPSPITAAATAACRGLRFTASRLEAIDLTPLGSTLEPVVHRINGLRLAFLAFDDVWTLLAVEAALRSFIGHVKTAHSSSSLCIGARSTRPCRPSDSRCLRGDSPRPAIFSSGSITHTSCNAPNGLRLTAHRMLALCSLGNALLQSGRPIGCAPFGVGACRLNGRGEVSGEIIPFEVGVIRSGTLSQCAGRARNHSEVNCWGKTDERNFLAGRGRCRQRGRSSTILFDAVF